MRNKKIFNMTIDAMFLAIMAMMTFIPSLGFISLGGVVSVTLLHIVVLIGACYGGTKRGALYGIFFGLLSLLKAATAPVSILDPYFVNPLISVLPRFIFGLLSGLVFDGIKKIRSSSIKSILTPISAFALTMVHSVLVLGILGLLNGSKIAEGSETGYWVMMGSVLIGSSIPEAIAATVVVWPVSIALVPDMVKVSTKKDNSELLGKIGLYVAPFLPPLTWVISGIGLHQSQYFQNEKSHYFNKLGLILSAIVFACWLIIYMLLMN